MTHKSAEDDFALRWTKSSHSSNDGPDCVEVAAIPGSILVRDSKNPQGPRLSFAPGTWTSFLSHTTEH
ncbi:MULTISPECIES: DUF397 domain-containing protein [Streptomyces]|uniref:DUF397 domain-containing protein n=2 Tax=Streptomyces TaxID=1883 RepID=A0A3M8EY40_9ACTN|nr:MULTISPECIES: DUF397 domain-containing protein [Streptomyces]KNE81942.1 hypothetical protein ADZ36_13740 [Streptomyces fradiae]OFA51546.1 DUF397 domain-containing protein [Streptomyces fradiae]PQM20747.1 DUF397 domain-containing protein [Streptomyces xinghaiensis]RKM95934.1 DUF397 domain-containing protein [Streptomyces xinghaiensis]RNC70915.1 DUF397 domain-containing protein [Streptomyces xinghaiensis]